MSPKHREVDPKEFQEFQHITYRGIGLAAFTPNPKIKWKTSAAPAGSSAGRTPQAG